MRDSCNVAAIGDLIRDVYIPSRVERLSPESPSVVIEAGTPFERAGGIGIGVATLTSISANLVFVSAWSKDDEDIVRPSDGVKLINVHPSRTAPRKTRYLVDRTIVARVDVPASLRSLESNYHLDSDHTLEESINRADVVLVADYGHNVVLSMPRVSEAIASAALSGVVVWDFHPRSTSVAPPGSLVKFNHSDFLQLANRIDPAPTIEKTAIGILKANGWKAMLITKGSEGAALVDEREIKPLSCYELRLNNAIGAGDILSALWAFFLARESVPISAERAVQVTSIALAVREGVLNDIPADVNHQDLALAVHAVGHRLTVTAGCFDLLHAGHIDLLRAAKTYGDVLIVLVNSDASVKRLKGEHRPYISESDRLTLLQELRCVDAAALFHEDTPAEAVARLRPDVYVKGGDYSLDELPEAKSLLETGAKIQLVPRKRQESTSLIVERFR